jgi:hypothetical protein
MGKQFTDKYSLLHFSVGIFVYFWNVSFVSWFVIHMIFELSENTKIGMFIINQFPYWPGGKEEADSILNSFGDQFYGMLGWIIAYIICNI